MVKKATGKAGKTGKAETGLTVPGKAGALTKKGMATDAPDYIKTGAAGRGLENVCREDLVIPRVKLLQPMSPEVQDKGMKEGHLINNLSQKDYGDTLEFIPITHTKSRIYWQDREDGGGMLCASDNGLDRRDHDAPAKIAKLLKIKDFVLPADCSCCPFHGWDNEAEREKDQKPKCTIYYNFPAFVNGEMVALSLDRTKIRTAKNILTLATTTGGNADMFAKKYRLTVTKEKNDQYSYYNIVVEPAGWVSEEEYEAGKAMYDSFKNKTLKVEQDAPQQEQR
jgi:hypothetical protein